MTFMFFDSIKTASTDHILRESSKSSARHSLVGPRVELLSTGAMSSDADVAERNLKRGELERIRHLLQGLDKQQRRLEKLGVLSRAQNGEPSGILVEKKDDGAPGVHEGLSDITDADRRASAADQAVSNRAAR